MNKILEDIDDTIREIKAINSNTEKELAEYLKDDYSPFGYDPNGLKDKVEEMTDQKEQEDMIQEADDKIAEIMSEVIDVSKGE